MSEFPYTEALAALSKAADKIREAQAEKTDGKPNDLAEKTREVANAILEKTYTWIELSAEQKKELNLQPWEEIRKTATHTEALSPREIALAISLHELDLLPGTDSYITIVDTREELPADDLIEDLTDPDLAQAA